MFVEVEHFQVRAVVHVQHTQTIASPNLSQTSCLQNSAIAKELHKCGFKVGAMCVLEKGYDKWPGFIPGSAGAPHLPVVSNHQSALLAVSPDVVNLTQSTSMLRALTNGSVLLRDALPVKERITTHTNSLIRPGQKPMSLVRRCHLLNKVNSAGLLTFTGCSTTKFSPTTTTRCPSNTNSKASRAAFRAGIKGTTFSSFHFMGSCFFLVFSFCSYNFLMVKP